MYLHFDSDNWKFLAIAESGNIHWESWLFSRQEWKDWWSSTTFKHHNIFAWRVSVFVIDDGRKPWVFEVDVEGALSLVIVDDDGLSSGLEVDVDGGSAPLGLKKLLIFTVAPAINK